MILPRSFYTKTLYQKRKFALGWFVGFLALTILTLSFFPSFKNSDFGEAFNKLSPALQKVAGDPASFKTIGGYIDQQLFALRIPLLATILSIILLGNLTVGEERRGLLETQLSLPVSRSKLLLGKLAAGTTIIALTSIGVLVGVFLSLILLKEHYSMVTVIRELVGSVLVGLDFGLLTFMLGSGFGRRGLAIGASSAFAFLSYLITSLLAVAPALKKVEKASLFHYQNPAALTWQNGFVLVSVGIILIVLALNFFSKRDISA